MNSGHKNETATERLVIGSRRKFLQKTTAGVVIASIPAKSVWATGGGDGGILNSIAASTHASGWTGGQMALLSLGCWRQNHVSISSQFIFNTVFGGLPLKNLAPVSAFSYGNGKKSSRPTADGTSATFLQVMQANGSSLDRVNSQICAMYLNAYYGGSDGGATKFDDLNFPVANHQTLRPFASLNKYADWLYKMAKEEADFSTQLSTLISENHSRTCNFNEDD